MIGGEGERRERVRYIPAFATKTNQLNQVSPLSKGQGVIFLFVCYPRSTVNSIVVVPLCILACPPTDCGKVLLLNNAECVCVSFSATYGKI